MSLAGHESGRATSEVSCSHEHGAASSSQCTRKKFSVLREPTNTPGAYFEVMLHTSGTDLIWSEDELLPEIGDCLVSRKNVLATDLKVYEN